MNPKPSLPTDLTFLRDRAALVRVAAVTLLFAAGGAAYGLLGPRWYRSVLTVVPVTPQRTNVSSILGGELGGLAAGLAPAFGGGADSAKVAAVLQSNAVADAVIERFGLRERYQEKYQENAREALWRHCELQPLPKPNLVQLSCEDKDPRFVQELLGYFAEYGNQVFRRVGVSSASEEVRFLEKRVGELAQQADEAAARMRAFQEKHRIVDLDSQAKAVVSSMAALNNESITRQLELEFGRKFSSRDEATMRQLESQISVVDEKLRDLRDEAEAPPNPARASRRGADGNAGLFPAALAVPRLRAEFEKLYRDRKVAEGTLVFALERLEGAKANEARDVSTFVVLDPPPLPTRRSRPKVIHELLRAAAAGLVASLAFEWWRRNGASARAWLREAGRGAGPPGQG